MTTTHELAQAKMQFHPAAAIFELLDEFGKEFQDLVEFIQRNDLRLPIIKHPDGRILDGRNRYRACLKAGREPRFETWDGVGLAADYVYDLNWNRRHLDDGAKLMAAARYAIEREAEAKARQLSKLNNVGSSLPIGDNEDFGRSVEKASDKFGFPERTISRAIKVEKDGAEELKRAVARDEVSVSAAADVATLPHGEQQEIVARGEKEILAAAKEIRGRKAAERHTERVANLIRLSEGNAPLASNRKYPVIYADPPWKFHVYDAESGMDGAAENHYPTMEIDEICRLPVPDMTTPDAVLFMWTTNPHLVKAIDVINAWGFEYVTNVAWVKHRAGLGYWVRNQHEIILIARRGNMLTPLPANRPPSIIEAPRREHSRKPDEAYELIERMYPDLPKIELFARQAREGWAAWGNQAPVSDAA